MLCYISSLLHVTALFTHDFCYLLGIFAMPLIEGTVGTDDTGLV